LSNRRCAASRTSQAFHRRALSPSGELREKTDQLAVQSQVLAELNRQLDNASPTK